MKLNDELNKAFELSDDDLDVVVGGGKGGKPPVNGDGTDTESIKIVANQNIASGVLETMTATGVTGVAGVTSVTPVGVSEQEEVNEVNVY